MRELPDDMITGGRAHRVINKTLPRKKFVLQVSRDSGINYDPVCFSNSFVKLVLVGLSVNAALTRWTIHGYDGTFIAHSGLWRLRAERSRWLLFGYLVRALVLGY